jgi:hypothetical protein
LPRANQEDDPSVLLSFFVCPGAKHHGRNPLPEYAILAFKPVGFNRFMGKL